MTPYVDSSLLVAEYVAERFSLGQAAGSPKRRGRRLASVVLDIDHVLHPFEGCRAGLPA